MAKNCINVNSKEFSKLLQETELNPLFLEANIMEWQESNNNFDRFPTVEELSEFINKDSRKYQLDNEETNSNKIATLPRFKKRDSNSNVNKRLDAKIESWLNKIGVSLTEVKQIMDEKGMPVDANAVADIYQGLIEIAEGKRKKDTLSEEASHILVELIKRNNDTLYKLLVTEVKKDPILNSVRDEYSGVYNGNEEKIIDEAIGKMVANKMVESSTTWNYIKRFLNNLFKKLGITSALFVEDTSAARAAANIILQETDTEAFRERLEALRNTKMFKGFKFYQLSTEQISQIEQSTTKLLASPKIYAKIGGGYAKTIGDIDVTNRVTDKSKEYSENTYGKSEQKELAKNAVFGTILHSYTNFFMKKLIDTKGKADLSSRDVLLEAVAFAKNENANKEEFKKFAISDTDYMLGSIEHMKEVSEYIKNLYDEIIERGDTIAKRTGSKAETLILPEFVVYDSLTDTGGTIDLLIRYPDGSADIFDYKSMRIKGKEGNISYNKEEIFDIQIQQYMNILMDNYNIKTFGRTRIIPINIELSNDKEKITKLEMLEVKNKKIRQYLKQIPVAREMRGSESFQNSLRQLYDLKDSLIQKVKANNKDEISYNRLNRVREIIKRTLVYTDSIYIITELDSLFSEWDDKKQVESDIAQRITAEELNDFASMISIYKSFLEDLKSDMYVEIKELKDEALEEKQKLLAVLNQKSALLHELEKEVNRTIINRIDEVLPSESILEITKEFSYLGAYFNTLSDLNHPAFRKLSKILTEIDYKVLQDVDADKDLITEAHNKLLEWAKSNGHTMQEALDMIIDENVRLIGRYDKEFYKERDDKRTEGNIKWFAENYQVTEHLGQLYYTGEVKEEFDKTRIKFIQKLEKMYPEKSRTTGSISQKSYTEALDNFDKKYNVTKNSSALLNKDNYFARIQDMPDKYSAKYKFMLSNEPLKNYYDMYVQMNDKFAEMTGHKVDKRFIANIHSDMMEKIFNAGIGLKTGVMDRIKSSLMIRQYDEMSGTFDEVTGTSTASIPLLYSDNIAVSLTQNEINSVIDRVRAEFTANGKDVIKDKDELIELEKREITKARYEKGKQYKSRDLSRSLLLFSEAAHSYKYLTETEGYVRNLLTYLQTNKTLTIPTDGSGNEFVNKYKDTISKTFNINNEDADLLEKFIKSHWYGQKMQSKDNLKKREIKDKDGNVIDAEYFSTIKGWQAFMQYVSNKSLAFNIFPAIGNLAGSTSNYYFLKAEGSVITQDSHNKALKFFGENRKDYLDIVNTIRPFTNNLTYMDANDLSSSKVNQLFTTDNAYAMMRKSDEMIDAQVTMSMLYNYGLSETGRITKLDRLPAGSKNLMDLKTTNEKGKIVFTGVSTEEMSRFRLMIQKTSNKIKGSMSDTDKAAYNTNIYLKSLMQFKGWMPGLINTRFKGLQYDPLMDEFDVGRFKVALGEITGSESFLEALKVFGKIALESALFIKNNKISREKTAKYLQDFAKRSPSEYKKFVNSVKETKGDDITIDDLIDELARVRQQKLNSFIIEFRYYLAFLAATLIAGAMIPEDDEDEIAYFVSRNLFNAVQRGFLEVSFFFDLSTVETFLAAPSISAKQIFSIGKLISNGVQETSEAVGITPENTRDRSPMFHYFFKDWFPMGSMFNKLFNPDATYNK